MTTEAKLPIATIALTEATVYKKSLDFIFSSGNTSVGRALHCDATGPRLQHLLSEFRSFASHERIEKSGKRVRKPVEQKRSGGLQSGPIKLPVFQKLVKTRPAKTRKQRVENYTISSEIIETNLYPIEKLKIERPCLKIIHGISAVNYQFRCSET